MLTRIPSIQKIREQHITIAVLLAICVISFLPYKSLANPVIASDDWSLIVAPYVFGDLKPIDLLNHRPIDMSLYYALTSLFGLRFEYFYLINALILFLSAVLIYLLVKRIFSQQAWFASLVAIAYLIYPVDATRTWIIMLYIRFWWLINLAAIWLMLDFVNPNNKLKLATALICVIVSLGAYEGQFGMVATTAFLIAFLYKDKPVNRRLVIFGSILFISLIFYIWRFHIQANLPNIKYYSVESFQFTPSVILERYLQGINIFLIKWLIPVRAQLELSFGQIFTRVFLYGIFCYGATFYFFKKNTTYLKLSFSKKLPILKSHFVSLLIGGAFFLAGYFPIIGLYGPSLNGHASRVNLFAVPGAALMISSIAFIFATLFAISFPQIRLLATALLLPFILTGIFVQLHINKENQIAWDTQRNIWSAISDIIPNIQDEKDLVVVIPDYEQLRPFESYPFTTAWEIDAETKVFYNNSNISGIFYYKDLHDQEFKFTKNGIIPPGTEKLIGYKRLIFVYYDPEKNRVELIENIEDTFSLPFSVNNYSPYENIAPAETDTGKFRWLIQ